jgi:hypothetical protein
MVSMGGSTRVEGVEKVEVSKVCESRECPFDRFAVAPGLFDPFDVFDSSTFFVHINA